jgi:thiol-disulfide isomerase/thioredoxin
MFNKLKKFFMKNESLSLFLMIASLISIPILIVYLLKSITNESFDYNPHKELIFFSMPGCGHCKNFKPTWDLLLKNYGNIKDIELIEVSSNEKPELVELFEIDGFPTILYAKDNKKVSEYKGDRSYEDLVKYMKFCMSS